MFISHRIGPVLAVVLLALPAGSPAGEPIGRSFESLQLGMTDEAFLAAVPSVEMRDTYLNLLPEERFFRVKSDVLPKGVAELTAHLYKGRLYKIQVAYVEDWFDDAAWNSMVESGNNRYGKAESDQRQLGEGLMQLARWEDKTTVYIIRRQIKPRFRDQKFVKESTVYVTYLDQALWDERLRAEGSLF
jgi:hypothetical protein